MLDNSLLKYSLNSPLDKARVGFSLGNGCSMKVYPLLIAVVSKHIDMTFEQELFFFFGSEAMAFEYLILADYRTIYIYITERRCDLASYDISLTISHTLHLHIQCCNVFHRIVFVQKKKRPYCHRHFLLVLNCYIFLT